MQIIRTEIEALSLISDIQKQMSQSIKIGVDRANYYVNVSDVATLLKIYSCIASQYNGIKLYMPDEMFNGDELSVSYKAIDGFYITFSTEAKMFVPKINLINYN